MIRGNRRDFSARHPSGSDCLLLIEVADTSLAKDRARAPLYAAGGVPEYWIVDLTGKNFVVYRDGTAEGYQTVERTKTATTTLPGGTLKVSVQDLLGEQGVSTP